MSDQFVQIGTGHGTTAPTHIEDMLDLLSVGGSSLLGDVGMLESGTDNDRFNWQSMFAQFADLKQGFAMGRFQGTDSPDSHTKMGKYDWDTNTWTWQTVTLPRTTRGHVYGLYAPDHATGDSYYIENGGSTDRLAKHAFSAAVDAWTFFGDNPETLGCPTNILQSNFNYCGSAGSMSLHPNLYTGAKGLVIATQFGFAGFNLSTQLYGEVLSRAIWNSVVGSSNNTDLSSSVYCRGRAASILSAGFSAGALAKLWEVKTGPVLTALPDPPLWCGQDRGGTQMLKLFDSPYEDGFYGAEMNGTRKLYKSNAAGLLVDMGVPHPITSDPENMIFAPIYHSNPGRRGVHVIAAKSSGGWQSTIWKPPV